ncbi:T9SS type A sorting domain-containing protein [bacterium]|nr:MAG: T9SS type A sorting domain-containing protein [bacterium]
MKHTLSILAMIFLTIQVSAQDLTEYQRLNRTIDNNNLVSITRQQQELIDGAEVWVDYTKNEFSNFIAGFPTISGFINDFELGMHKYWEVKPSEHDSIVYFYSNNFINNILTPHFRVTYTFTQINGRRVLASLSPAYADEFGNFSDEGKKVITYKTVTQDFLEIESISEFATIEDEEFLSSKTEYETFYGENETPYLNVTSTRYNINDKVPFEKNKLEYKDITNFEYFEKVGITPPFFRVSVSVNESLYLLQKEMKYFDFNFETEAWELKSKVVKEEMPSETPDAYIAKTITLTGATVVTENIEEYPYSRQTFELKQNGDIVSFQNDVKKEDGTYTTLFQEIYSYDENDRITKIDYNRHDISLDTWKFEREVFSYGEITSVEKEQTVSGFGIKSAYPNPFNPTTNVSYELTSSGVVHVRVFDVLGRQVATLFPGNQNAGAHTLTINASGWSSGVYMILMQSGNQISTKKISLIK